MYSVTFSWQDFLAKHWHQSPTIIRGGFANFIDPISPDEVAGLALEQDVDSRFINNANNQWQVEHGPFDESHFESLPESHFQLVVQAANHWHPDVHEFEKAFDELPKWLFDDVMVCFSAPKGGVGPHIDQYDVFIVQGMGKRHWKVGAKDIGQYQEKVSGGALRQITGFEPIIDEVLEPGDILYIPPGFPHEGDTLEPSLSYSVGYRSPKAQELFSKLADYLISENAGDVHWHRPGDVSSQTTTAIASDHLSDLKAMLLNLVEDETKLNQAIALGLSESRHHVDLIQPEQPFTWQELSEALAQGASLVKTAGLRVLTLPKNQDSVFINGEAYALAPDSELKSFVEHYELKVEQLVGLCSEDQQALESWVNEGYWYLQY